MFETLDAALRIPYYDAAGAAAGSAVAATTTCAVGGRYRAFMKSLR